MCTFCLCGQLNVYTPVAQAAQDEFVPEQPGVIQKGLTAARETIQPYVRAAQVFVLFSVCLTLHWARNHIGSLPEACYDAVI